MSDRADPGDLVRIRWVVLEPDERSAGVPADTRATPFVAWANGILVGESAPLGRPVTVRTATGRLLAGELVDLAPRTDHDFGSPQPELIAAAIQLREILQ
jgi:2-amino-4-ketopentanoate thiolase alpha subunit